MSNFKPIVNSITPSAIRAEHQEIDNLRLEKSNLSSQLSAANSELERLRAEVERLVRALSNENANRRKDIESALQVGTALGLTDDDPRSLVEAARDMQSDNAALKLRVSELEARIQSAVTKGGEQS